MEWGTNIEAKNKAGDIALVLAASNGGYEDAATVRLLSDSGADARVKDKAGNTALTFALRNHRTEIVFLLRKAMAHPLTSLPLLIFR